MSLGAVWARVVFVFSNNNDRLKAKRIRRIIFYFFKGKGELKNRKLADRQMAKKEDKR